MTKVRSYSELSVFDTFDERFDYLKLGGGVGTPTFGHDRFLNQQFYASREWHDVRDYVICRDEGCDLGIVGYEIYVDILIHHMNAMTVDDIVNREPWILDPEYLITTSKQTHNDIHYGVRNHIPKAVVERIPGDTKLW